MKQRNQDKNTKAKTKSTKCERPKYKQIFIAMKLKNVNTKKTEQGYKTRLKIMGGHIFIIPF
jgi:hypothetical protein